jgi:glutamate transport system substrate-binding protein
MFEDGTFEKAFDATLGKSGNEPPEAPEPDPCEA